MITKKTATDGVAGEPEGSDELDEIERVGSLGEFVFAST